MRRLALPVNNDVTCVMNSDKFYCVRNKSSLKHKTKSIQNTKYITKLCKIQWTYVMEYSSVDNLFGNVHFVMREKVLLIYNF